MLVLSGTTGNPGFGGRWTLDPSESTPVDPWNQLTLEFDVGSETVTIKRIWSVSHHTRADSVTLKTDGTPTRAPLRQWLANRHLGVRADADATREMAARWADNEQTLIVESRFTLATSQGTAPVRTYTEYRLSPDGTTLTALELRSTRPRPIHYVFTRANDER